MKQVKHKFLKGKPINPKPIPKNISVTAMVDDYFQAYNAGRLREACQLFTEKIGRAHV